MTARVTISLTRPQVEALLNAALSRAEEFAAGDIDYGTPRKSAGEAAALSRAIDTLFAIRDR